jgi:queuine tRNA-ribosyltransferase
LTVDVEATDGAARTGVVATPRGRYRVPCFMPVGTRGAVRTLTSADLEALGIEVVLGNTYHLMLRPGADVVGALGGLHGFMAWSGHVLTDSGGFQVFSLEPKLDESGATFRSTYDGSLVRLTPEDAVRIQEVLGADIQMVLDVCPALPAPTDVVRDAVDLTARWAERARATFVAGAGAREDRGLHQAQFGIVQGGVDVGLRADSARRTVELGFDGYAVGGLSVGESRAEMHDTLAATLEGLPGAQPRYLMGVGDPVSLVTAISLGIDMFDCVLPTRHGRHGTVLTDGGRLNLRNARFATDRDPLDPACPCPVCARWSRGYLRHLLGVGEQVAARLVTIHNVAWTSRFVARTADAIRAGRLGAWRSEVLDIWS